MFCKSILGRYCNLACIHCHVESGPTRKEMMSRENVEAVLRFLARTGIPTLDITGGAPELHADFAYLVESARRLGRHVMDRCNLTVIFEPGKELFAGVFQLNEVELVCSFPCYPKRMSISSAAKGLLTRAFARCNFTMRSATAKPEGGLVLNLVYNPVGPHLPPPQEKLEQDYKQDSPRAIRHRVQSSVLPHQHADHPLCHSSQAARRVRPLYGIARKQLQRRALSTK